MFKFALENRRFANPNPNKAQFFATRSSVDSDWLMNYWLVVYELQVELVGNSDTIISYVIHESMEI